MQMTIDQEKKIHRLRDQGMTNEAIANRMGVRLHFVQRCTRLLHLHRTTSLYKTPYWCIEFRRDKVPLSVQEIEKRKVEVRRLSVREKREESKKSKHDCEGAMP